MSSGAHSGSRHGSASSSELSPRTRERLERELAMLREQRDVLRSGVVDWAEVGDRVDDAEALRESDELALLNERIASITRLLYGAPRRAPAPGGLPSGSMVTLRMADGSVEKLRLVDMPEDVPEGEEDISLTLDSPLGQAVARCQPGDTVHWESPAGKQHAELVAIDPPD